MAAVQAKQQVEMERIQSQEEIEGMKIGVQVQKDKEALASKEEIEGMRIGIDIARAAQQGKGKPK
jgi:hypothetical protein